jgi:hypothetical protein
MKKQRFGSVKKDGMLERGTVEERSIGAPRGEGGGIQEKVNDK